MMPDDDPPSSLTANFRSPITTKTVTISGDSETASLLSEDDDLVSSRKQNNGELTKRTETKILQLFWTTVKELKQQNEQLQKKSELLQKKTEEHENEHKKVKENLSENDNMLSFLLEHTVQGGGSGSEKNDEVRNLIQQQQNIILEQQQKIEEQQQQIEEQKLKIELIQENVIHKSEVESHVLDTLLSNRDAFANEECATRDIMTEPLRFSTLPEDTFSFMMCSKIRSVPFWLAVGIFGMQIVTFSLLADDLIIVGENPLSIPANVETPVRVTQVIAILVSIVIQDDLRDSIGQLSEIRAIDNVLKVFPDSTVTKWWLSCLCRFLEGVLGLWVTFCLIVTADNVFDILINFTAMGFVANLDNLAFLLCFKGIFGVSSLTKAEEIKHGRYPCRNRRPIVSQVLLFLTIISMLVGWLMVVRDQTQSRYLCETVHVELADNVIIDLGGYSGFYYLDEGWKMNGRVRYTQQLPPRNNSEAGGGMFAYCEQEPAWTFSPSSQEEDPCQWQAKSTNTDTFDLLETLASPWVARERNSDFEVQLDYIRITCFDDYLESCNNNIDSSSSSSNEESNDGSSFSDEDNNDGPSSSSDENIIVCDEGVAGVCPDGQYGVHCERSDPCQKIRLDLSRGEDEESFEMSTEYELLELKGKKSKSKKSIQAYSHPVYVGRHDRNDNNNGGRQRGNKDDNERGPGENKRQNGRDDNDERRQDGKNSADNNNKDDSDENNLDLIFYCGRRWVLTRTGALKNFANTTTTTHQHAGSNANDKEKLLDYIADYFLEGFHITDFDERAVVYISEVTLPSETPVGLRWYNAKYSEDPSQLSILPEPDLDNLKQFSFHCGYCKNEAVMLSDRSCKCRHRATGDRCEIEPLGDGICDTYFNKDRHNFDGGDCCAATCQKINGTCANGQELTSAFPPKRPSSSSQGGGNLFARENQVGFPRCRDTSLGRLSIQLNNTRQQQQQQQQQNDGPRPNYHLRLECGATMILNTTENIGSAFTISAIHIKESTECRLSIIPLANNNQNYSYAIYPESGEVVPNSAISSKNATEEVDIYLMKRCLLTDMHRIGGATVAFDKSDPAGKALRWVDQNGDCGEGGESLVQRYALAVLYYALGIESITSNTTWLDKDIHDECSWEPGITCNSDNVVTEINFDEKGLQGYIPTEIGLLSGLESIILRNNLLTGTIPSETATLTNLQWLDLSSNRLTGVVPAELARVDYRNFMNNQLT